MLVDFLSQNDVYKKYSILIDELETLLKTQSKSSQEYLQDKKQQIIVMKKRLIVNVQKFIVGDIKSKDIYIGLTNPEDILNDLHSIGILTKQSERDIS